MDIAFERNDKTCIDDLKLRIDFVKTFPSWIFEMNKLTGIRTAIILSASLYVITIDYRRLSIGQARARTPLFGKYLVHLHTLRLVAPSEKSMKISLIVTSTHIKDTERLTIYDYKNIYRLYFYQIAVCDYYGQYFSSKADNKIIYLKQAKHTTRVLEKTAKSMIEKGII